MSKLRKILNKFPFYILFFPWYSILFLYDHNFVKLSFKVIVIPFLITTLACLFIWFIFRLIFRKSIKAGILVGFLLLIIFMYGPLHKLAFFDTFNIGIIPIDWSWVYLFLSLVLLIGSAIYLIKAKRELIRLNNILNIGGVILMILVLGPLIYNYIRIHVDFSPDSIDQTGASETVTPGDNAQPVEKPDIYYIIPDDYGAPQTFKDDYGYDSSDFVNYLKKKGFYIAENSKTNYPYSAYMIASALSMNYLNSQTQPKIKTQPGGTVIDNIINNSKVVHFLKSQGYSFFNIGGWYDPLRYNDSADINFVYDNKLNLDEFSNTLLHNTIFYPLVLRYFGLSGRPNQIANVNYQFETLSQMPAQISPKFVFIDLLAPHTPWVFNENCDVVYHLQKDPAIVKFIPEMTCVNKRLMTVIDTILKNSKTPPIIILQSDEGAKDGNNQAIKYPNKTGVVGGFKDASIDTNLERVRILNAFYLPGNHQAKLYPEISPVNTFRYIFDEYFNNKLPLLPDQVYTFDDYDKLYRFIFNDITDQVKDL